MEKSIISKFYALVILITIGIVITFYACTPIGSVVVPTLAATTAATNITATAAVSGGNIIANGGATVTASGIVWGTTANPTVTLTTKTVTNPVTVAGAFTGNISGLTNGVVYYVRSYATNSAGTGYGTQTSFTAGGTTITVPVLATTTSASAITATSATSGGNITSNGGATITASGIVWSTSTNPAVTLTTKTTTSPVVTSGAFTGSVSGLTAGTTYYVRAYATNSVGTGYGTQTSFTSTSSSVSVPTVYSKMYGCTVTADATWIYIHSSGMPDHKSPYYKNTTWEATRWISDTHSGFIQNPNKIDSFYYTFKIPRNPVVAATHTALGTATVGVAVNGVPLFNQYAAGNSPIVVGQNEYVSFDLYGGHPAPTSDYHYHIQPTYITSTKGTDALIGFLMDGFPVYGPVENGVTITNTDLDAYHGHFAVTSDYPSGIYHYHTTAASPYINGNGYYGTSGTWTRQ